MVEHFQFRFLRYGHTNSITTILSWGACFLTTFNLTQRLVVYLRCTQIWFLYFEIISVMTRLYSFIFVIEYQTHKKPICPDFQNVSHTCLFLPGLSTMTPFVERFCVVRPCHQTLKLETKWDFYMSVQLSMVLIHGYKWVVVRYIHLFTITDEIIKLFTIVLYLWQWVTIQPGTVFNRPQWISIYPPSLFIMCLHCQWLVMFMLKFSILTRDLRNQESFS